MQRNKFILSIFCLGFLLSGCASAPKHLVGKPAPATHFTMLEGNQLGLREFRGKPVVIVFWAMECKHSPKTVERINAFVSSGRAKGAEFLAVSLDKAEDLAALKEFLKYRNMDRFDHAFSGNESLDEAYISFEGRQIPLVIIVDAQGKIAAVGNDTGVVEDFFA